MTSAVNTSPIARGSGECDGHRQLHGHAAGEDVGQRFAIDRIAAGEDCGQADEVQSRVRLPDAKPAEKGGSADQAYPDQIVPGDAFVFLGFGGCANRLGGDVVNGYIA